MTANYVLLEKITVGAAGASSVTFSGIPQTGYTDLVVKTSVRGTASALSEDVRVTFNGSATGYSDLILYTDNGTSAKSYYQGSLAYLNWTSEMNGATSTTSTFNNAEFYIPNYTSGNYKSVSGMTTAENNGTAANLYLEAGLWANTAAITSITLTAGSGTISQYSTFYLYGVAKLAHKDKWVNCAASLNFSTL